MGTSRRLPSLFLEFFFNALARLIWSAKQGKAERIAKSEFGDGEMGEISELTSGVRKTTVPLNFKGLIIIVDYHSKSDQQIQGRSLSPQYPRDSNDKTSTGNKLRIFGGVGRKFTRDGQEVGELVVKKVKTNHHKTDS
ncbi:hypothetical protein Prudu_262S000100 [Prunus dulcis]|uniref:Uncharacterized protein n=1 Tax=Prunus dulcis TaxID=3755 RepID=A0A5H2XVH9_PRUDU|nr:hypothetical protein Prudu_262S000100 [Prunus dulcis]